jgi:hypothetical protein
MYNILAHNKVIFFILLLFHPLLGKTNNSKFKNKINKFKKMKNIKKSIIVNQPEAISSDTIKNLEKTIIDIPENSKKVSTLKATAPSIHNRTSKYAKWLIGGIAILASGVVFSIINKKINTLDNRDLKKVDNASNIIPNESDGSIAIHFDYFTPEQKKTIWDGNPISEIFGKKIPTDDELRKINQIILMNPTIKNI